MAEEKPTGPQQEKQLDELREGIAEVDRALLELIHRRMDLAAEVGRLKAARERPIMVPEVHDRVLRRARRHAEACGVSEGVMESIFSAVMQGSIERQHKVASERAARGASKLLIIGGAGNMGGWLQGFARRLGHVVEVVDPAMRGLPTSAGRFASLADVEDYSLYDAILVTVPLKTVPEVIEALIERQPRGLLIEIASIKDHLREVLDRGTAAGLRIASLHPMFGPGKSLYETLTFVLACREDPQTEKERIDEWLRYPNTHLVSVPFDHHDRLMGWLLGLGHLTGMLFGRALDRSGLGLEELDACASTTYERQLSTARSVLQEDPDLYFDIQQLNPHRAEVYEATRTALEELVEKVQNGDRDGFRELLSQASHFVGRRA